MRRGTGTRAEAVGPVRCGAGAGAGTGAVGAAFSLRTY